MSVLWLPDSSSCGFRKDVASRETEDGHNLQAGKLARAGFGKNAAISEKNRNDVRAGKLAKSTADRPGINIPLFGSVREFMVFFVN
jgi:hypothetical protein